MLYNILLGIMIIDGLILGVVILLQSGKGGGLAAVGGGAAATDGVLAGRQATTLLTRSTWTTGGIFLFLALTLSILSSRQSAPQSITRPALQQSAMPVPVVNGGGGVALPGGSGGEAVPPPAGGGGAATPPDSGGTGPSDA